MTDDRERRVKELRAKLSDALQRRAVIQAELDYHGAHIADVRKVLGNPFFYESDRPEHADQSEDQFTGTRSHEPGLGLLTELQAVKAEIDALLADLHALRLEPK